MPCCGASFPDKPFYVEGEPVGLSKGGTFMAQHLLVPKEGVAVHINAYNFPIWGMLEKIAVNLLAGMPAVVKPAVPSAYLTEAVVREIIASGILPEGALQLVVGSGQGILDHVTYQDVVTFTGSAATGAKLRAHPRLISEAVPFTLGSRLAQRGRAGSRCPAGHAGIRPLHQGSAQGDDGQVRAEVHRHPPRHRARRLARRRADCPR